MQPNIGLLDRYVRLVGGLVAYTSAARLKKNSIGQAAMLTFGAMKIAEGVTGWCPLMYACGIQSTGTSAKPNQDNNANQAKDSGKQTESQHESSDSDEKSTQSRGDSRQKRAQPSGHSKQKNAQSNGGGEQKNSDSRAESAPRRQQSGDHRGQHSQPEEGISTSYQ